MFDCMICVAFFGLLMGLMGAMDWLFSLLPERVTDKLLSLLGWD